MEVYIRAAAIGWVVPWCLFFWVHLFQFLFYTNIHGLRFFWDDYPGTKFVTCLMVGYNISGFIAAGYLLWPMVFG